MKCLKCGKYPFCSNIKDINDNYEECNKFIKINLLNEVKHRDIKKNFKHKILSVLGG